VFPATKSAHAAKGYRTASAMTGLLHRKKAESRVPAADTDKKAAHRRFPIIATTSKSTRQPEIRKQ
jgi:hypothetical protein